MLRLLHPCKHRPQVQALVRWPLTRVVALAFAYPDVSTSTTWITMPSISIHPTLSPCSPPRPHALAASLGQFVALCGPFPCFWGLGRKPSDPWNGATRTMWPCCKYGRCGNEWRNQYSLVCGCYVDMRPSPSACPLSHNFAQRSSYFLFVVCSTAIGFEGLNTAAQGQVQAVQHSTRLLNALARWALPNGQHTGRK